MVKNTSLRMLCSSLIVIILISLIDISYAHEYDKNHLPFKKVIKTLPAFSKIDIHGAVQIVLQQGASLPSIEIPQNRSAEVEIYVQNKTLKIEAHVPFQKPFYRIPIKVVAPYPLQQIVMTQGVDFYAENLRQDAPLTLMIDDQVNCHIKGLRSSKITLVDHYKGKVLLQDIKSQKFYLYANGRSQVYLNGSTTLLDAKLRGHARLLAKNFQTTEVYVDARDEAKGYLSFQGSEVRAFVRDDAYIYYFATPRNLIGYSGDSGNLLPVPDRCHQENC